MSKKPTKKANKVNPLEAILEDLKKELNKKNTIITMHEAQAEVQRETIRRQKEVIMEIGKKAKPQSKYIKMILGTLIAYSILTFVTLTPNLFDWSSISRVIFLLMAVYLGRK